MKASDIVRIIMVLLPLFLFGSNGDNVDQEIIVLFGSDVIELPAGQESASLDAVTAPKDVIDCLQAIGTTKVTKAMPRFSPADTLKITDDGWIARLPNFSHLYRLLLETNQNRDLAITKLETIKEIVYAEKNGKVVPFWVQPNDYWFTVNQWNLNDPTGGTGVNVMKAWSLSKGSNSIKIGIIDTGIDTVHSDLKGRGFSGDGPTSIYDSDHGTHVCGIAAAMTNNSIGVAGMDWYAKISNQFFGNDLVDLCNAVIEAVDDGCRIVNCSWGWPGTFSWTLYNAFTYVYQHNVLPVAAMPYSDPPICENPGWFGPWMLDVAGTDINNNAAYYTWERCYVDVAAPGGETDNGIFSTAFENNVSTYEWKCGTSMAAPHVSGLAGLLLAANSGLKNYDLEWIIKLGANDVPPAGIDYLTGYGIIDAYEAVRHVILPYQISRGNVAFTEYENVCVTFTNTIYPWGLPAGYYLCDQLVADIWLNFSPEYVETPWGWLSLTGFSANNPNDATYWMNQDVNTQAAHLFTCFYYLKSRRNTSWPYNWIPVNQWAPVDPYLIPMQYTIIGRRLISAPTNLNAAALANSNNIKLTWTDNSSNELKFMIERRLTTGPFVLYDSVGQNITQYTDDNTTSGQTYGYQVYAKAQEFYTNYTNADYATAGLAAPTNLTATDQTSPNAVNLQWQDNSSIEAGFHIARKVDNGNWNENYKTVGANITQCIDTVSFLHTYEYRVCAYDNYGRYSDWSGSTIFTAGSLAQSNYSEMSAFNNQKKIALGNDGKLHLINYDGTNITYTYSTDQGISFAPWNYVYLPDYPTDTTPVLSLCGSGDPYTVFGCNQAVGGGVPPYKVRYYSKRIDSLSYPDQLYSSSPTNQSSRAYPPSHVYVGDSGYIAFQHFTGSIMVVGPCNQNPTTIASYGCSFPSIGFDGGNGLSRLVVLAQEGAWDLLRLYYRSLSSNQWNSVEVPNCYAYGSPSLWVGTNEVRIAFEGWDDATQTEGLLFVRLTWSGNTYVAQPTELISTSINVDQCNGVVGYSYWASSNVVLWRYNNDIWYARRTGTDWTNPVNISNTDSLSSYPQGVVFINGWRQKLFALWTEKSGSNYCLVRKVINIPLIEHENMQGNEVQIGNTFAFENLFPNPTKGILSIRFTSPDERRVVVKMYDVTGRLVETIYDGKAEVGLNAVSYNSHTLPNGVYFLILETNNNSEKHKITIIR